MLAVVSATEPKRSFDWKHGFLLLRPPNRPSIAAEGNTIFGAHLMPTATAKDLAVLMFSTLALFGCVKQQHVVIADKEPAVHVPCQLTENQVNEVRQSALAFLLAEWPVLDAQCEGMATGVKRMPDGKCAIFGGPLMKEGCPIPSHSGYIISFDEISLEPLAIYWPQAEQ